MRRFIDALAVLMVIGLLAGATMHLHKLNEAEQIRELARGEVHRLQQQVLRRAALTTVENRERGYPETIDPEWFHGNLPRNPLLGADHPWLEVASAGQRNLKHPPLRIASDSSLACFWYNPYTGIVRGRVPSDVSDAKALELYNRINDCRLSDLFGDER